MTFESTQQSLKALVVDPDPVRSSAFASHVWGLGFADVIEAVDGELAWKLAQLHQPDLVLIEVKMPGLSGLDLCKRLKDSAADDKQFARTGVILLTDDPRLPDVHAQYGADAWLGFPYTAADLDASIREVLARYGKAVPGHM